MVDQQTYLGVAEVSFDDVVALLQSFQRESNSHGAQEGGICGLVLPVSHPSFAQLLDTLTSSGIDELLKKRWDYQFMGLKAFKREHGDCFVPIAHPTLGLWTRIQRDQYRLHEKKGSSVGLTK